MVVGMASATTGPRSSARSRAGRVAVAVLAFGATFLVATPARATCSLLDLDCLTDSVSEAADEATDEVTETVDDVVGGVTDTAGAATTTVVEGVESVVTTVEETVEGVVAVVEETVDGVVAAVEETVEGAVGGGSGEEPRPGTDGDGDGERPRTEPRPGSAAATGSDPGTVMPHAPAGPAEVGPRPLMSSGATVSGASASVGDPASVPSAATSAEVGVADGERVATSPPAVRDAGPSALAEAARTLAFPLALTLLIALFLIAQNRIDRRAPKLAFAPVEPDVVGFRRAPR
jgi:hypothetical protein